MEKSWTAYHYYLAIKVLSGDFPVNYEAGKVPLKQASLTIFFIDDGQAT